MCKSNEEYLTCGNKSMCGGEIKPDGFDLDNERNNLKLGAKLDIMTSMVWTHGHCYQRTEVLLTPPPPSLYLFKCWNSCTYTLAISAGKGDKSTSA